MVAPHEPLPIVLRGHPGIGKATAAAALVCDDNFSARYDVNRRTGRFSRPSHQLFGVSLVGQVCVFNTAKGGVATAWALLDMQARGLAPAGLIFRLTNPIIAQGAALAAIPLFDRLEPDPLATIQTDDWLELAPARGLVTIVRRGAPAR